MSNDGIEPQPGRRPVYPVDSEPADKPAPKVTPLSHVGQTAHPEPGQSPPPEDPASDKNTESANHPNDE